MEEDYLLYVPAHTYTRARALRHRVTRPMKTNFWLKWKARDLNNLHIFSLSLLFQLHHSYGFLHFLKSTKQRDSSSSSSLPSRLINDYIFILSNSLEYQLSLVSHSLLFLSSFRYRWTYITSHEWKFQMMIIIILRLSISRFSSSLHRKTQ